MEGGPCRWRLYPCGPAWQTACPASGAIAPALEANIERRENSVIVRAASAALDATAVGRILAAESDGQRFAIQTPGACIATALATPGR